MTDNLFHLAPPPSDFEQWLTAGRRAAQGGQTRNAILGGLGARLYTNQMALAEFWSELFTAPASEQSPQPTLHLYAVTIEGHGPLTAFDSAESIAVMVNRIEREAMLDAMAALTAIALGNQTALVVRGSCVKANGKATLVLGAGHAAYAAQLGQVAFTDLVLVRVTLTRQVDGVQLAPTRILTERGQEIRGADIWQWLRDDAYQEPRADVFCLNLDQRDEPVMARDLDLGRCAEPYAYPLTKAQPLSTPPLITEAVILKDGALIKLSSDLAAFTAHLKVHQPWLPDKVTQEALAAIQCQAQTERLSPKRATARTHKAQDKPGLLSGITQRWRKPN